MSHIVTVPVIAVTVGTAQRFFYRGETLPVGVSETDVARLLAAGRIRPSEAPVTAAVSATAAPVAGEVGQVTVRRTRARAKAQG